MRVVLLVRCRWFAARWGLAGARALLRIAGDHISVSARLGLEVANGLLMVAHHQIDELTVKVRTRKGCKPVQCALMFGSELDVRHVFGGLIVDLALWRDRIR